MLSRDVMVRTEPDAPEVTIVIPVWDTYAGTALRRAVGSITSQRCPKRVLLVDNASQITIEPPEGTEVVRTPGRLTVGAARNFGLDRVRTEYVVVWDADDVMLPGTLELLLANMQREDRVVACASSIIDGRTGARHHWPRPATFAVARARALFAWVNSVSSLYPTTGALLRTAAARACGGFPDADGGEDWVLGVSLAFRGRVNLDAHPGRLYARHGGSNSARWRVRPDIVEHARLVRRRLRDDEAVPTWARRTLPAIALFQHFVMFVLRPISRRLPARRRAMA